MIPSNAKVPEFKFYRWLFWLGTGLICLSIYLFLKRYTLDSFEFGFWTWVGGSGVMMVIISFSKLFDTEAVKEVLSKDFMIHATKDDNDKK